MKNLMKRSEMSRKRIGQMFQQYSMEFRKRMFNKFSYRLFIPAFHRRGSSLDARKILQDYSPCPGGTSLMHNQIDLSTIDLQIIVPAYNVEKYLRSCMKSILSQKTKYTFAVTLIDDGSSDTTSQIVDEYLRYENVDVLHKQNEGLSSARNVGLKTLAARYVAFVDSDDLLAPDAIDILLDKAYSSDADIVEGNYYDLKGEKLTRKKGNYSANTHGQAWGKVYKSSLFSNIGFPTGYWFEDSVNAFIIFSLTEKMIRIPDYVYIHRKNMKSITHIASQNHKCIDTYWITELMVIERAKLGLAGDERYYEALLHQVHLNAKRISETPMRIQESVFCLSRELVGSSIPDGYKSKKYAELQEAMKNNDFGVYRLFCRCFGTE